MEEQILQLLRASQMSAAQPRQAAEAELLAFHKHRDLGPSLANIGIHKSLVLSDRLAALVALKNYVNIAWSASLEDYDGSTQIPDDIKATVRHRLMSIVYDDEVDSKITSTTAAIIAIIAKSDFPEDWPDLLDSLLHKVAGSSDDQIQAILVVLGELVLSGLDEDEFYKYAEPMVNALYGIATDGNRKLMVRAHAVQIFRSCFDFVENLKDKEENAIRGFAKGVCDTWTPFFLSVVKEPMPQLPTIDEEDDPESETASNWRGVVALKVQVVLVGFVGSTRLRELTYHDTDSSQSANDISRPDGLQRILQCLLGIHTGARCTILHFLRRW